MGLIKCDECKTIMRIGDKCCPGMNFVWCERCGKKIEKKTKMKPDRAIITREGFRWLDGDMEMEMAEWESEYGGVPGGKKIDLKKVND